VVNRFAVRIWSFTPRSFALATDISHISPIGSQAQFSQRPFRRQNATTLLAVLGKLRTENGKLRTENREQPDRCQVQPPDAENGTSGGV
jgi:hypothetical protein